MKQKLKRFMAGFMAMLTLVGTLFTNGTTAFAASPQANIAFWNASVKNSGEVSELKPGYNHGKILYSILDGNSAYCMNFGLRADGGQLMNSYDDASTSMSAQQRKLLSYCLYYGFNSTQKAAPSNSQCDEYIATQAMVWVIVADIFGTGSGDSAARKLCNTAPSPDSSYSYYERLRDNISSSYNATLPSFASRRTSEAPTYELKWNEGSQRFEATLSDSNGVLSDFDIGISGYSVDKNGNSITISSTSVNTTATTGTFTSNAGKVETTSSCVFWLTGKSGYQEFISERPTADPIKAYIKVKTENIGYGELTKTDESSGVKLSGAVYGIYSDSGCTNRVQTMTTDGNGYAKSAALVAGTYYVKEITAPKGYVLSGKVYTLTVKAGQTTGISATDKEQLGAITIYKEGEGSFDFDIKKAKKVGADFRNDLCNGMVKYFPDHFEDESKFCKALFIKKYPSSLSDRFINEITSLPVHSITSIDVVPVPKDLTTKVLQKKYLGIESDIIKQQRVRNKNNDFSTEISYAKRTEKKEIEEIMDDVRENDQCLFFVGVTIILMAESKKELDSVCETVETIGKRNSCTIDTHYLKQREALNTALPIGVRQVETMRTLLTQSLAVLMPFNVQELNDSTGNYYGINQISKNVNIGNRKKLINGNGFVFGVPGSGKSFFCKMEMGSVFLSGDDEIIVIDPMNEYFDIAETYGGTVVNMSTYTDNYVNPLEMDVWSLDPNDSKGMVREKGEFMLGLCEQCIGDSLNSRQKSIIDRCVRKLYIDIARSKEKYIPVMSDFYDILMAQPEDEAKDIALSLELFVNGSLNIFNHQTNVDVDNRFTVYGIRDLGTELSPITMLVMMESIQNRIVENGKRGKATWLYIDEFHVLLNSEYSAKYLQQLWKKVRKQGGLCTGITQNVVDLLQNYTATTMLANSEFVALLKQANTDSSKMAEVIGVSEAQLRFVTNTASGMGLIKCGSVVIPFDNQISKDTDLYRLYNTNIHEKIAEQKKKEAMLQ